MRDAVGFALVIGAMKCGTTSLFRQLGSHPAVSACRVKEPGFFSDDARLRLGFDWYESLWDCGPDDPRIRLEASTAYTKRQALPSAAERIAKAPAGFTFRFLYLLRDPVERIESHFTHELSKGRAARPLEAGIPPHLVDVSRYAMQLDEYARRFPVEHLLLLDFEELKRDPAALLRRACRFLDIDPSHRFPAPGSVHNPTRGRRMAGRTPLRRLASLPGARWLARRAPAALRDAARERLWPRVQEKERLSEAQRAWLARELAEDRARLRDAFGFDSSGWQLPD